MNARPTTDVLVERMDALSRDLKRVEGSINSRLDRIDAELRHDYITRDEFLPVKIIVYGFVGMVLVAFMGLMIYVVGWSK